MSGPPPALPSAPAPDVKPTEGPTLIAPDVTPPPASSSGIKLDVTTEPAGATVTKNGFQVCDQTPCHVMAELNETLELEAAKGALRAKARVLAQRDQKVTMKLVAPGKPKPRLCEVEVDGLKILRPCQ